MIKRIIVFVFLIVFYMDVFPQKAIGNIYDIPWPPKEMFIRIFKHEMELEVWVSDSVDFYLYKRYNICKLSGEFGPKRKQGDLQVPEGFYYINEFNPYSKYYLSMGVSYPNTSDRILSPYKDLGGLIYLHGDCVSVGCIAMGNEAIAEIYRMARQIKSKIQIHIFPINYRYMKSLAYFDAQIKQNPELLEFQRNLFEGYMYFQETQTLPKITFLKNGFCQFN